MLGEAAQPSTVHTLAPGFQRVLTAWDQPETVWGGYTLHTVDVSDDGRADLVWNTLGTINRTYASVSEF
ncbi:hypothetical protein [Pyxidicoccus xibeiensis]|uniref:hypothetical protein n=1 Tax=Pyxidicoccus xibeiensis TaxID=2906759 RepID=UPI0020A71A07|nr:hypothetical protein [Pyxidicoccus xibeiensis]MCP3141565.1 hypothetical protein [Pyxidicoccus xibeiensis]